MTSRTFIFLALALQVTWSIPLKQGIGGKLSGSVGGGIRAAVEGGIGTGIKGAEKLNTEMGGGYSGEGGASVKGAGGISGGGSLGGLGGYSGEGGASINGVGGFSGSGSIGGLGDYSRDVGASIEGLGGKIRSAVRGGSSVGAKMEGSSSKAAGMKGNVDLDVGKELGFSSGIRLFGSGIGEGSLNGGISGTGQVEMSKATGLETNKGMGFDKLEKLNGGSKVAKSETGNSEVETGRNKESSGQSGLRIDGKYNINSQIQGRSTDDEKITDGATNEANLKIGNEKEGNGNVEMTGNTNKETSVGESESSLEANVDLNALGASIQALIDGGKIDLDGIDYQQLALLASNLIDLGELGMGGNLELQGQGSTGTSLDLEKLTALLQNGLVNAGGSLSVNAGGLRGLGGGAGGQGGLGGGAGGQGGFGGAAEGRVGLGGAAGGQGGLGGAAGGQGGLGGAAGVQVGLGGAGGSVNLSPSLLRRAIQLGLFPMKFLSSGLSGAANSWGNLRSGGILGAKHQAGFTGQLLPNIKAKMSGNAGGEQRLSAIGGSEVNLNGRGGGGFRLLGSAPSLGWNVQTPRVKFNVGLNRKPEINRDLNSNVEVATNVKSHSKTS